MSQPGLEQPSRSLRRSREQPRCSHVVTFLMASGRHGAQRSRLLRQEAQSAK